MKSAAILTNFSPLATGASNCLYGEGYFHPRLTPHKLRQDVLLIRGESLHHVAHPIPEPAAPGRRRGPVSGRHRPDSLLRPCDAEWRKKIRGKISDAASIEVSWHNWYRDATRARAGIRPKYHHLEKLRIFITALCQIAKSSHDST